MRTNLTVEKGQGRGTVVLMQSDSNSFTMYYKIPTQCNVNALQVTCSGGPNTPRGINSFPDRTSFKYN